LAGYVSGTEECVRAVADEILRGQILSLDEALCYPGLAIIPITTRREQQQSTRRLHIPRSTLKEDILNAIVGSIPLNTCGVMILDSLGDVITFKLHKEVHSFWERINSVERVVAENYRDSRKPLNRNSAIGRATAFLIRLRNEGTDGVMRDKRDFFAVSLTDAAKTAVSIEDYLESTAAILYTSSGR
jgi:hypothetical protein